jgi:signal transduction histidine kinase
MTFKSASIKLTAAYLLIVMIISISFSVILYRISSLEIGRGLSRQGRILEQIPNDRIPEPFQNLEKIRQEQLIESNRHLKTNLIYFNLIIFILAGAVSYYLARRTLRPIEEMMDLQNRFTADASHELRTPLTAMRTEIEVALRDKKTKLSDIKQLLKSNLEEINKLEVLSNSLLKLANYENNKRSLLSKISLKDSIKEAYQKISPIAKQREIKFILHLKEAFIKGEASNMTEVFKILFDNAIKYSPKNSKVFVNLITHGNYAEIKVKDEGIGIKATDLPFIFNRFYRADVSRSKEKVSGYGLGLAIAKKIIEDHKGTITAESKPDHGSTFTIRLPLAK